MDGWMDRVGDEGWGGGFFCLGLPTYHKDAKHFGDEPSIAGDAGPVFH